jgi:predicted transcriptional regulator
MEVIRSVGQELVDDDFLLCTQKGNPVKALKATGPIRFGLSPHCLKDK